jgi:hypothetical protein
LSRARAVPPLNLSSRELHAATPTPNSETRPAGSADCAPPEKLLLLDLLHQTAPAMATNGAQEAYAPSDVLAALATMRGSEPDAKKRAHEYLESFQKSVGHLRTFHALLDFPRY